MSFRPLIAAFAVVALWSCSSADKSPAPVAAAEIAPILDAADAVDVHSYAKPLEARVTHVALDLAVDFEAKRVGGTATLDVQAKPGIKQISSVEPAAAEVASDSSTLVAVAAAAAAPEATITALQTSSQ